MYSGRSCSASTKVVARDGHDRIPFGCHLKIQQECHRFPFIFPWSLGEDLKVITRLGLRVISLPVAGFLPGRPCFSFTKNLPNPEIRTSSPEARVPVMIPRVFSSNAADILLEYPHRLWMLLIMSALVRFMRGSFSRKLG